MSLAFASASSQYLNVASGVVSDRPLTMMAWVNSTSYAASQSFCIVGVDGSFDQRFLIYFTTGTGKMSAGEQDGASNFFSVPSAASPTANIWHHVVGVFAAANSRSVFLDGVKATSTTSAGTHPAAKNRTAIGASGFSGALAAYMNGRLAEVAIWNVALSDAEVAWLATGASPLTLIHRLANLKLYQPLIRSVNDFVVGPAMTAVNGPTAAEHCRAIYPTGPLIVPFAPAVARKSRLSLLGVG